MPARQRYTGARPVRFERGQGWVECEPHRAQRWQAVFYDRQLKPAPYCSNKQAAAQLIEANVKRHAPLCRSYKLGRRMEKYNG